jgi:pimeloyl-ACP methyl ester carboxylesterase
MSDINHVVLTHGMWSSGDKCAPARCRLRRARLHRAHPTLRYHELPLKEGANKIAPLSLRDYTDDLVALVASLDTPPLLVGHSLGGLLAQLVAAHWPCRPGRRLPVGVSRATVYRVLAELDDDRKQTAETAGQRHKTAKTSTVQKN